MSARVAAGTRFRSHVLSAPANNPPSSCRTLGAEGFSETVWERKKDRCPPVAHAPTDSCTAELITHARLGKSIVHKATDRLEIIQPRSIVQKDQCLCIFPAQIAIVAIGEQA